MSALTEEFRALWLPGLNKVIGNPPRGIVGLLAGLKYQIYSPITTTSAACVTGVLAEVVIAVNLTKSAAHKGATRQPVTRRNTRLFSAL